MIWAKERGPGLQLLCLQCFVASWFSGLLRRRRRIWAQYWAIQVNGTGERTLNSEQNVSARKLRKLGWFQSCNSGYIGFNWFGFPAPVNTRAFPPLVGTTAALLRFNLSKVRQGVSGLVNQDLYLIIHLGGPGLKTRPRPTMSWSNCR